MFRCENKFHLFDASFTHNKIKQLQYRLPIYTIVSTSLNSDSKVFSFRKGWEKKEKKNNCISRICSGFFFCFNLNLYLYLDIMLLHWIHTICLVLWNRMYSCFWFLKCSVYSFKFDSLICACHWIPKTHRASFSLYIFRTKPSILAHKTMYCISPLLYKDERLANVNKENGLRSSNASDLQIFMCDLK